MRVRRVLSYFGVLPLTPRGVSHSRRVVPSIGLVFGLLRACVSGGARGRVTGPPPMAEVPSTGPRIVGAAGLALPVHTEVRVQVLIGADWRPDLETLVISGVRVESVRGPIEGWLADSAFKPARRDGVPVAAVLRSVLRS